MDNADRVQLQNVPKSRALMIHAAAAIHHVTILQDRPASIRTAALYGMDRVIDDDRLLVELLIRRFEAVSWKAPQYIHVGLKAQDVLAVKECQRFLGLVANRTLSKPEALIVGLVRMARPEFGWPAHMTYLDL